MAKVSRAALSEYRRVLSLVSRQAGSRASDALAAWMARNPGASVAECREAAKAIVGSVVGAYGGASSALACDLFDSVMTAEGVSVPAAEVAEALREGAIDGTVRRVAGDLSSGDAAAFLDAMSQLAEREVTLAAGRTVEENVERASRTGAGRRVRYARVPTSPVPCEWCAMLASRGFVYHSAEGAEAGSHHHCFCTIVPGVQGSTEVAGYDPEHYRDVWQHRERYEGEEGAGERQFANSLRQSPLRTLTDDEIASLVADAESIGVPVDILAFNSGTRTGFVDRLGTIDVRGDVLPDMDSTANRDRMTPRAVLAHEYYGHALNSLGGDFEPDDWRDEFRASYRAALDTPNLTQEERASLMIDAYQRATDAGVTMEYSDDYRRIVYGY